MFAGRDASCTHIAMSSTRVMGTACVMGQAVGTSAALAAKRGITPPEVNDHIPALQQQLLEDDCFLPGFPQAFSTLTTQASLTCSQGDPEPVRDGYNRPIGDNLHGWRCYSDDWLAFTFPNSQYIDSVNLVLDSALDRLTTMSNLEQDDQLSCIPDVMAKELVVEGLIDGAWSVLHHLDGNYQRLLHIPVQRNLEAIRVLIERTWGQTTQQSLLFM